MIELSQRHAISKLITCETTERGAPRLRVQRCVSSECEVTMIWRTPEGHFLIRGKPRVIPINEGLRLPNGETIHEAAPFHEISAAGEFIREYRAPSIHSVKDELCVVNIHSVFGTSLVDYYWAQKFERDAQVTEQILLRDLQPYEGSLPVDLRNAVYNELLDRRFNSARED